jgi:hypothetical protein
MECRNGMPEWNARMECRNGMPEWNAEMECRNGMPEWNAEMECQNGMPKWNARQNASRPMTARLWISIVTVFSILISNVQFNPIYIYIYSTF